MMILVVGLAVLAVPIYAGMYVATLRNTIISTVRYSKFPRVKMILSKNLLCKNVVFMNVCWLLHVWHVQQVLANVGRDHGNTWLPEMPLVI